MTNPHFAWLPPEINSALMFAGPGAGPLLAAAAAWGSLAEELGSAAASFSSVAQDLTTGSWLGASSAAMMAVATQYMSWLSAAALQAEQAAAQATATASAFEAALAATVQPAVIAANRGLVQMLASTNFFGMNWPAIMDTESAYEQMWALDVVAMANYHFDASAAAAQLAPWQQVLRNLGIDIGKNGQFNLGFGNNGSGNIGNNNIGNNNWGSGNVGSGNLGSGNTGSGNIGSGNTGSNNFGFGNFGSGNIGFANTGSGDFGFGLTGDQQFGFGGFNSGTGNVGFGNSGSGNVGLFNSGSGNLGIGNSGSLNFGLGNSGNSIAGFGNGGISATGLWHSGLNDGVLGSALGGDVGLSSAHYATGGLSTAASGILNSALTGTGSFGPGLAAFNTAPAAAAAVAPVSAPTGVLESGNASAVTPNATSSAAANSALRTTNGTGYAGVFSPGNDAGVRNPVGRESILNSGTSGVPNSIPKSGFYSQNEREPIRGIRQQLPSE
ncbi:PPE family protein [Mycobacterium sp. 1423905.2]|uniref:PPE family protein n=1 Tax=Mycobacterium sp. 1423905.2 TaxID=1856859 RepID=UPI0007FC17ED|nr:PPE domain-containing protein [Mycobacterium sp. 1423905.2]OBJ48880.1 hypothetical protein A9W95_03500 [Mycobacterium sp. 1423905.2]